MPTDEVCPVCRGRDVYERIRNVRDEAFVKAHKDADPTDPKFVRPFDGRDTTMRLLTPEEATRSRATAARKAADANLRGKADAK